MSLLDECVRTAVRAMPADVVLLNSGEVHPYAPVTNNCSYGRTDNQEQGVCKKESSHVDVRPNDIAFGFAFVHDYVLVFGKGDTDGQPGRQPYPQQYPFAAVLCPPFDDQVSFDGQSSKG